jgi:hypothetical protein
MIELDNKELLYRHEPTAHTPLLLYADTWQRRMLRSALRPTGPSPAGWPCVYGELAERVATRVMGGLPLARAALWAWRFRSRPVPLDVWHR